MNTVSARLRLRLRALGRQLCDQLRRPPADGHLHRRVRDDRVADAVREVVERCVAVQLFGTAQVKVPFIDARGLHDGRVLLQHRTDFPMLDSARLAGNRHAHGVRAEAQRLGHRHGRLHAKGPRGVGGGAHDAAALRGSTHEQVRRLARALWIDPARHRDKECVGVDEQDAAGDG